MFKQNEKKKAICIDDKKEQYPSAELLLEACTQDYLRIQNRYDKLYEKVNIALAFAGIVIVFMFNIVEPFWNNWKFEGVTRWWIALIVAESVFCTASVTLIVIAIIKLLMLLKSRTVEAFKSEDIRNSEVYYECNEIAAMWLIDKYTIIVHNMRPIIEEKQKAYDYTMWLLIIGVGCLVITIFMQKGGF